MLFTGAVRVNLSAGAHKLSAAPNVAACNPNKISIRGVKNAAAAAGRRSSRFPCNLYLTNNIY